MFMMNDARIVISLDPFLLGLSSDAFVADVAEDQAKSFEQLNLVRIASVIFRRMYIEPEDVFTLYCLYLLAREKN